MALAPKTVRGKYCRAEAGKLTIEVIARDIDTLQAGQIFCPRAGQRPRQVAVDCLEVLKVLEAAVVAAPISRQASEQLRVLRKGQPLQLGKA